MSAPTGLQIVTNALIYLGIVETGGTASNSDAQTALNSLNDMWDAWSADFGLIYSVAEYQIGPIGPYSYPVSGGEYVAGIQIGPGGDLGFLPSFISSARWIVYVGTNPVFTPLKFVTAEEFFGHTDPLANAIAPSEIYIDWNTNNKGTSAISGAVGVFLYPTSYNVGPCYLSLSIGAQITTWALNTAFPMIASYQDAVTWSLAQRLLPLFGVAVQPQVAALVEQSAAKAEARVREMNARNRLLAQQQIADPGQMIARAAGPEPATAGAVRP
jgi:hypothetical protein